MGKRTASRQPQPQFNPCGASDRDKAEPQFNPCGASDGSRSSALGGLSAVANDLLPATHVPNATGAALGALEQPEKTFQTHG